MTNSCPRLRRIFLPGAGALARLIPAIQAFGHGPLKPLRANPGDQIREAGVEDGRFADRVAEARQDFIIQQLPPVGQPFRHHVALFEYHHVEDVVDDGQPRLRPGFVALNEGRPVESISTTSPSTTFSCGSEPLLPAQTICR